MSSKIIEIENLPVALAFPERRRGKVVQSHGCFDCCHIGHMRSLKQAKSYGDILIVTVTSDKHVNKGPDRPIFNQKERMEALSYLEFVDYVALSDYPDASIPISKILPSVFCKGTDYSASGISEIESKAASEIGANVLYTTTEKYSTSEIIEKLNAWF